MSENSTTLSKESSFIWACPDCEYEQTEVITIDGPVMSLVCAGCGKAFDDDSLPEPVRDAWVRAINRVIPKHESD